jgi:hypothetical protein
MSIEERNTLSTIQISLMINNLDQETRKNELHRTEKDQLKTNQRFEIDRKGN